MKQLIIYLIMVLLLISTVSAYSKYYGRQLDEAQYYFGHVGEYTDRVYRLNYQMPENNYYSNSYRESNNWVNPYKYQTNSYTHQDNYDSDNGYQTGYIRNPSHHTRNANLYPDYARYYEYTYDYFGGH